MATPEALVKKEIREYLDSLAPSLWYFVHTPMGYGVRGIPDIVGVYKGRFFGIEVKAEGGKAKPWQDRILFEFIKPAGGIAIVADNVNAVRAVLNAI